MPAVYVMKANHSVVIDGFTEVGVLIELLCLLTDQEEMPTKYEGKVSITSLDFFLIDHAAPKPAKVQLVLSVAPQWLCVSLLFH